MNGIRIFFINTVSEENPFYELNRSLMIVHSNDLGGGHVTAKQVLKKYLRVNHDNVDCLPIKYYDNRKYAEFKDGAIRVTVREVEKIDSFSAIGVYCTT